MFFNVSFIQIAKTKGIIMNTVQPNKKLMENEAYFCNRSLIIDDMRRELEDCKSFFGIEKPNSEDWIILGEVELNFSWNSDFSETLAFLKWYGFDFSFVKHPANESVVFMVNNSHMNYHQQTVFIMVIQAMKALGHKDYVYTLTCGSINYYDLNFYYLISVMHKTWQKSNLSWESYCEVARKHIEKFGTVKPDYIQDTKKIFDRVNPALWNIHTMIEEHIASDVANFSDPIPVMTLDAMRNYFDWVIEKSY